MKFLNFLPSHIELADKDFFQGLEILNLQKEDFVFVEDFRSNGKRDNNTIFDFSCVCEFIDYLGGQQEEEVIIISYQLDENDKKIRKSKTLDDKMSFKGHWKYVI